MSRVLDRVCSSRALAISSRMAWAEFHASSIFSMFRSKIRASCISFSAESFTFHDDKIIRARHARKFLLRLLICSPNVLILQNARKRQAGSGGDGKMGFTVVSMASEDGALGCGLTLTEAFTRIM